MDGINPRVALVVVVLVVAGVGAIVWSTMGLAAYTAEVCVTFQGRTNCATASGTTREEAIEMGVRTACGTLAGGVEDSITCGNSEPDSVRWIEE